MAVIYKAFDIAWGMLGADGGLYFIVRRPSRIIMIGYE